MQTFHRFLRSMSQMMSGFRKKSPFFFWSAAFFTAFFLLALSFYCYIAYLLPLPDPFVFPSDYPTTKIYDRNGTLLYEVLKPELGKNTFVPLQQIPHDFVNATLAAEDIHYYSHAGVDPVAIVRAIVFNVSEGRIVSGASTITQQLVRNLLGHKQNRDIADKMMEAFYAIRLSHVYSKEQILELYLNRIYYGNLSYGAESAAQGFFGKHISDVDLAEASFLAGLPQSPSRYNPFVSFEQAKKRQQYVLNQMAEHDFISHDEADSAFNEPLRLKARQHGIKAPHFVQYVLTQLEDRFGDDAVTHGGLTVTTTLDYNLQLKAENTVDRQVEALAEHHVTNGALISLDVQSGQILAWVGSKDYFNDQIDGAVDMVTALRQPGSSIKPLTYLQAFEKGFTPATILSDIPTQFSTETGPYAPKNYDLDYHGPVRARIALASSYNIPAVKTLEYVGVENFLNFLSILGIDTLKDSAGHYGLALTLGGGEVRLIDMAQAYSVIANYGALTEPISILSVSDQTGTMLYQTPPQHPRYVLGPYGQEHAFQIIDILKDPNARIPGFGEGSVLELTRDAAVKTGTTRNFRDNWTIGFTPSLLTAVWVGNADATPMENISGVDGAGPIWAEFMEGALQGKPRETFFQPSSLRQVEICALSGMLPTPECRDHIFEWFVSGTEPHEPDNFYRNFTLDTRTGRIIPPGCLDRHNPADTEQKVLVAYPPEFQKWAEQKRLALPQTEPCYGVGDYPEALSGDYPDGEAPSIKLDSPLNNDEFLMDSQLPLKDQRIPFRVTVPADTQSVTFQVDGKNVGTVSTPPYTYLWLPVQGTHSVQASAKLSDGHIIEGKETIFFIR